MEESVLYNPNENIESFIKFNDNKIKCKNIYPYVYDYGNGKEVLRLEVLETDHNFDEILKLKDNTYDIYHYENEELKCVYEGYYKDFICNYKNGIYNVEIYRISKSDLKIRSLDQQLNPTIDIENCSLEDLKTWQISNCKLNLEYYLENNPIKSSCHGEEKYYTITKEKQSLLTQMILITQLAIMNGVDYQPSWNAKDEQCTYDWTLEQLQQLSFEIEGVVRPLISKQQTMETNIKLANTKEEVMSIDITF